MSLIVAPTMCVLVYAYAKLGQFLIQGSQNKYSQRKRMFAFRIVFASSISTFTIFLKDPFCPLLAIIMESLLPALQCFFCLIRLFLFCFFSLSLKK